MRRASPFNKPCHTVLIAGLLLLTFGSPLSAAPDVKGKTVGQAQGTTPPPPKPVIDPTDADNAIRRAKILDPNAFLKVTITNTGQAIVSTEANSKWMPSDLKINAVLMAKTLSDASKEKILRVLCIFFSDSSHTKGISILVTHGDLIAYGSGGESKDELVNSLLLSKYPPYLLPSPEASASAIANAATLDKATILALGKARQALMTLGAFQVSADDPRINPMLKDVDQIRSLLINKQIERTFPIIDDLNDQIADLSNDLQSNQQKKKPTSVQEETSSHQSDTAGPKTDKVSSIQPQLGKQIESLPAVERMVANRLQAILGPDTPCRGGLFFLRVQIAYLIKTLEASHKDVSKERAEYEAIEANLAQELRDRKALRDKLKTLHSELNQAAL